MLLTMFVLVELIHTDAYTLTILLFLGLLILQAQALFKFINKSNEEVTTFLNSIRYDDLSLTYSTASNNSAVDRLNKEFNKVMDKFREIRKEKEADFQYMKNIVQHVGIGLITFDKKGNIQIINSAAKKLLQINKAENIRDFESRDPELVDILFRLKTGGRDLIKLELNGDIIQLAVFAIELTLRGEEFKLVSIQNIHNELEEKEMDAWQNLVRVLTHEIMNSVTPISSLAGTVEGELKDQLENDQEVNHISNDDVQDLYTAVQTIQKRSEGLISFVQDFRNLTHIPKPNIKPIKVSELVNETETLLQHEVKDNEVILTTSVEPADMEINGDKAMLEQVLINLVKNAIQAFDEETNRIIEVKAYRTSKGRPEILVKDNGGGIDEEAMEKIFIPFFTTKKSGSGIGLSLSRQIMRKHQGTLSVRSVVDEGTEFTMRF